MVEISLAPMMKITTPQFRTLIRKLSQNAVLFTEMIVSSTVVNVSRERLRIMLGDPEHGTVVQLGGSDPKEISESVRVLKSIGWTSFNLNCGCPSGRVQSGRFGAVLMMEKENVADIVKEVYRATGDVLSLKIRTGVDDHDSFEFLSGFVGFVSAHTPCFKFYVHARKCWLKGLNPKQNRNVPLLNYQFVYDLKECFPHLFISLNGGLKDNCLDKLQNLDGLMIGRHAWNDIRVFSSYEGCKPDMKLALKEYFEDVAKTNPPRYKVMMPLINYRKGRSQAKVFKQLINEILHSEASYDEVYEMILPFID